MKKILTVTLNPAFDFHAYADRFVMGAENYVTRFSCDAGGKGVNVSRALVKNQLGSVAYVVMGRENAAEFESLLAKDSIEFVSVYTDGRIRENVILHPGDGGETRINLDTFSLDASVLDSLYEVLVEDIGEGTVVVFSGRLPRGICKGDVIEFLHRLTVAGARLVVDCNLLSAEELRVISPWLIKPNEQEVVSILGREVKDLADAASAARELVLRGISEQVMISLGGRGLVWSDGERRIAVEGQRIEQPLSTVGAGDSTVAGYLAGVMQGLSADASLRLACAFGTAACMTEGTKPPEPETVSELFGRICGFEYDAAGKRVKIT